jgi:hypothetical protein
VALTLASQNKYAVKVPSGLAFSEFKEYEAWQVVSISQDGPLIAATLANSVIIKSYYGRRPRRSAVASRMRQVGEDPLNPIKMETFPAATVPGTHHDVDFMVDDSKRFADRGAWGYAVFDYYGASDQFTLGTLTGNPPEGNDAKLGSRATRGCNVTDPFWLMILMLWASVESDLSDRIER